MLLRLSTLFASPRLICSLTRPPTLRFLVSPKLARPLNRPPTLRFLATMSTDPSKYKLNHTMLRVKDPQESLKFYQFLGMSLIDTIKNPDAKFDLYFLAYDGPDSVSKKNHRTDREGIIELTHNYGTESDPEYKIVNGNTEPYRGFGHVCISVDNIQAACARLETEGYKFQKRLSDGQIRHIAFVLDPDGYWVEIIPRNPIETTEDIKETSVDTYRMNHTMLRVKDINKSLAFYKDVMGMTLVRTLEMPNAKFNLYFLRYGPAPADAETAGSPTRNPNVGLEGLLELTYNYGTELDPAFKYHNGNDEPQGFGHIAVTVDDLELACKRWEEPSLQVKWRKRLTEGRMKSIAFILDPDGYWVEIVQNESLKK
ncbi:Glyoxalase/bleomycin resistance protein/dioxygenase [Mycena kentingensis (nom. inval.)]|nr:Glyoxalase/bleomycin resistance protein/dioxygenase [Mycena kentingensis (nom. inval.)]